MAISFACSFRHTLQHSSAVALGWLEKRSRTRAQRRATTRCDQTEAKGCLVSQFQCWRLNELEPRLAAQFWEKTSLIRIRRNMMLILTRYIDEAIVIGQCRVTVLGVVRYKHGRLRVKLGIEAPRQVAILREELTRQPQERSSGAPPSPPHASKKDTSSTRVSKRRENQ